MADQKQKSQAERAAATKKNTYSKGKAQAKKSPVKSTVKNVKPEKQNPEKLPTRLISSVICLFLFIFLLVAYLSSGNPKQGAVVKLVENLLYGFIGSLGFGLSIPVLLYLFFIHAFSGKRPVRMRTICLITFILICGCLYHLFSNAGTEGYTIGTLWTGGIEGTAGGVLCGGISCILAALLGSVISKIILIVAAFLTLLGGMQFTPASIIRAIQNRPRADWDDAEEERQEPAAVVVNHLANKRIAYIEKKRQAAEAAEESDEDKKKRNAKEIISQMDTEVDTPVSASKSGAVSDTNDPEIIPVVNKKTSTPSISEDIPETMPPLTTFDVPVDSTDDEPVEQAVDAPVPAAKKKKITAKEAEESAEEVAQEIQEAMEAAKSEYAFPPIDLLKLPSGSSGDGTMEMRDNTRRLNETLASFKIDAHITNVTRGPSVTRYEVELEKGVRLNKLTTAADDIALNLGATGVRIAAIPGKISVVGIEVPNRSVNTVSLREVIDSKEFCGARSKSSFAVGKDIGGTCIVGNIAKLPHMLIAGTTGSGKSVCMNSIIISLLYKATPDEVKLIMVDPKMVELGIYNDIPHLLIPVVTDPKKAAGSLQWAVTEMMRRYKAMSDAGVRDLESYNSIMESEENPDAKLPQVVVIIDELADLMLVAAKEVEESICRIAQMGRAAGIHLIIATQRPSADVITGLMKANIPSRIAFAVASAMESRIILDTQGAEKLVGKGDMLYAPIGDGKPRRVQGCFVSDPEVEAVATFVKNNCTTNYDQQVIEEIDRKAAQTGNIKAAASVSDIEPSADENTGDDMLPAAVDVILETGQASVSMLQRRLKLGYARAARIVDEMEERGIVGPFAGSKPREILVTKEQWQDMRCGQTPAQMEFSDLEEEDAPF